MKVTLNRVRLSFPALFKAKKVNEKDQGDPKFNAVFLLDKTKDAAQIDALRQAVVAVAKEKWPGAKLPAGIKYCVRDGAEKEDMPGYGKGVNFVSASNQHRPSVVDRDLTPIVEDDNKIYAGCYVNAVIRLWAQDNSFGKRINAQLNGVQFVGDGEAFGEKPFNAQEEFQPLDGPAEPNSGGDEEANTGDEGDSQIPF